MALTKSSSARSGYTYGAGNCTAGSTVTGTGLSTGYGVTAVGKIVNGATAPTTPCAAYVDYSADNSTWISGPMIAVGDLVASSTTPFAITLGIGSGADFAYYRIRFTGNTGQAVGVGYDDSTTTGI